MSRRSRWLAPLTAIGVAFAMVASAVAYNGQVAKTITVSPSSGTFTCSEYHLVRATVLDLNGRPVRNVTVRWSITSSPSLYDKVNPSTSRTNNNGVAFTWVKLTCKAGDRVITATTDGISGSAVVHVKLRHHHDGGYHFLHGHHGRYGRH